jgi:hypothetical protein
VLSSYLRCSVALSLVCPMVNQFSQSDWLCKGWVSITLSCSQVNCTTLSAFSGLASSGKL